MVTTFQRRYKENVLLLKICKWIADIIIVICVGFTLSTYLFGRVEVSGNSMESYLNNGDSVLINQMRYTFVSPKRFDIIAFQPAGISSSRIYIKRVIGLPGETIQIKDGKVFINGSELKNDVSTTDVMTAGLAQNPITLGKDDYFVLGDNRNSSEDSRFSNIGTVKRKDIIGGPWVVISPLARFKIIF